MITLKTFDKAVYDTIVRATTTIAPDIDKAFRDALDKEHEGLGKVALETTYENVQFGVDNKLLVCSDTGWPLFFIKLGEDAKLEGGLSGLEDRCRKMVAKATEDAYLRATVKHPITGYDTGNNVGANVPAFTYHIVPGSSIEVIYVSKGGGSECFGGTRYQVLGFADGVEGIEKFVIESYISGCRAGKICSPSLIGVGVGGTADISAKLAKEASSLRTIGSRHPEPEIAALEERLEKAINMLGIGCFGLGGSQSVFCVNVEYAFSHIGGIAVSVGASCCITRRATTVINDDNTTEIKLVPDWFEGR
ncbi:MAG: fumarate hydratase [Eubacteriales bacterium]|nr:fumarate hydratase [Eubacteriales bacterium]